MEKEWAYGTGMWAWLLQRITGVLLVFYLFIHIIWAHGIKTPFDFMFVDLKTSVLILLLLVLPHALNGFRVFAIDLGIEEGTQKILFWVLVFIGALVIIWGIP